MKKFISNNGDVTINTETETSTIGCQSGGGCSAAFTESDSTYFEGANGDTYSEENITIAELSCGGGNGCGASHRDEHTVESVTHKADGSTETYSETDLTTAQVGCTDDGCGASYSDSHEDTYTLETANGSIHTESNIEATSIGCASGSGCSASTSETHTTSGVTYNADGSTHTYNTVDTETAQVGCTSDGCGASASRSHEDNSHLVTAEGNTYTTSNSNSSSIGCQTGKGCEASYKDSKKSESIVDGKTTTHIQTTDLTCGSGSSCNASTYKLDSTVTQNADGTTTRDYTEFGVQCEGEKCNGSIATDELDDLEDMVDNIRDFDVSDLVEIPNGIEKEELANITASLTPDDASGFIQFVKDNPLATAGGAAGGVAALLGAYYAISGRRREDDDSATLINRDDGEGAGDGLEGGLENGSTGSPTGEPAIVGEGTGTPIEPVIIGGNTTAPEGVTEREGNSDTEDLPDDEFYVLENVELLQNYYYATTKEQAGQLLSDICKKDPANTNKYIDALSEAVQNWNECSSYEEQMEKYGRPAEEIMLENYSEYREPEVSAISQHIKDVPRSPTLTEKNKSLLATLYLGTNKNDTKALLHEIITSDPKSQTEYENYFNKLESDAEKYASIKGLNAALEITGKEYNSLDDYKYKEEVQEDPERQSALFQMFLRRNKLEIAVEEKRKLFEEKKANGDVITTELKSTRFKYTKLTPEQRKNNCKDPGSQTERDNFEKNMADSLNSLCDSYWFEIIDGNITIHELEGVEETKPKAKELLQNNFIDREKINKGKHNLDFVFSEKSPGLTLYKKSEEKRNEGTRISSSIVMNNNVSLYHPTTPFKNKKKFNKNLVKMEYMDHDMILAHELIHSMVALDGKHDIVARNDHELDPAAYPGKIPFKINKLNILFEIREQIRQGKKLGNKYKKYMFLEVFKADGTVYTLEEINDNILAFMNIVINSDFSKDLVMHKQYNLENKKLENIALYKEEAHVTYDSEIKRLDGQVIDNNSLKTQISENDLRRERGENARMNYILNSDNQFYFKEAIKFVKLYEDNEFEKQVFDKNSPIDLSKYKFLSDIRNFKFNNNYLKG